MIIYLRYGERPTPKNRHFSFLVEDVLCNQYIVYAKTLLDALTLYQKHHTYETWSIRQMADNE